MDPQDAGESSFVEMKKSREMESGTSRFDARYRPFCLRLESGLSRRLFVYIRSEFGTDDRLWFLMQIWCGISGPNVKTR